MADNTNSLWNSIPWQRWGDESGRSLAWHKPRVPYLNKANALQNIDVWIPSVSEGTPDMSSLKGIWVIYIHGGAWRDPLVDASSFAPTISHVIRSHGSSLSSMAGFASINYTLSPHPNHPTDPSPPKDPSIPADPSRTGRHPDHIADVLRAISFLQQAAGFKDKYVLLGHSCGATLAFQALMDVARWSSEEIGDSRIVKPVAVVGLNGLYDLPELINDPGEKHASLIPIYEEFTRGAFGDDEKVWHDVSPISVRDWVKEWETNKGKVVLVQSKEDTLVPYRQLEDMWKVLEPSKSAGLDLSELPASHDHNELWSRGDRLAAIVVEVVKKLS